MNNPFLVGPRLYLRPPELEDAARLCGWLNDPAVRRHLGRDAPMSRVGEEQFLRDLPQKKDERILLMVLREQDRAIGSIGLHPVQNARTRVLGIVIGEHDCWSQGYGREAIGLLLDHAFGDLDLHRVQLDVHADNARAIACYEKLGFVREGALREAYFREGRFGDLLVMGILAREWRARRLA
jgi:[ribosomal protein S5]-alanine N-acetyltransferase